MRHWPVVLVVGAFLLLLSWPTPASIQKQTLTADQPRQTSVVLPVTVARYLASTLPEYRPASARDYDAEWFDAESEWNAFDKTWFHWIVCGDFDGNGATDYALLMQGPEGGDKCTALIVVRATASGWTHDVLESWRAASGIRSAIYTAPPGRYSIDLADEPAPKLKPRFTTSIFLTPLESCGLVHFYWEKGGWKQVYVGL